MTSIIRGIVKFFGNGNAEKLDLVRETCSFYGPGMLECRIAGPDNGVPTHFSPCLCVFLTFVCLPCS